MTLTLQHGQALLPILLTAATVVAVMLAIAIRRHHGWNTLVAIIGLNIALYSTYFSFQVIPLEVTPLIIIDGFALFFSALILMTALACITLGYVYFENFKRNREEFYLLMCIATLGCLVLVSAHHMASLFIGLEILSLSLYGLIAYTYDRARSLEAGIKYLVLSATASCVLLFGMSLLYAEGGNLSFAAIGQQLANPSLLSMIGVVMLMIGLVFKLSLAPFHIWTPDVYEGASAPIATYLATAAKVAVFAVMVRFLLIDAPQIMQSAEFVFILVWIAVLSILVGNLLALKQKNIKRLLAYSSIAHFGYLLVLLLTGSQTIGIEGFTIYIAIYVMTSLAAFGVVILMSKSHEERDADHSRDYRGLFWHRPMLTSVLTLSLLSLAGIPLTAGFIAKFYVINAGMAAGAWGAVLLLSVVIGSAISLYYYLNTIVTLFVNKSSEYRLDASLDWGQRAGGLIVIGAAGLVLALGIYPKPLMELVQLTLFP
ncbi:MAG: NADH-quinone oxidoreductase subunit NuoN [Pseudomonadota bacterium]